MGNETAVCAPIDLIRRLWPPYAHNGRHKELVLTARCLTCSPATVWRAPRFAAEGGQLAAGVVQCATLDLKETEFGWQSELVTTKKCQFSQRKTNDSIVFAQHGGEIAVCAPHWPHKGRFWGPYA